MSTMPPLPPDGAVPAPKEQPIWATYIEARTPRFKTHSAPGHAINAAQSTNREVWVFRLVDNVWTPWFYWDGRITRNGMGWDRPDYAAWMEVPTKEWKDMESMFQVIIEESPV